MRRNFKLLSIGAILFSVLFIMSCDSSDENIKTTLSLEEAELSDFPLFGIKPTGIEIKQPIIEDNKEITYGEIKITVPSTITSLDNINSSITSKELNLSKFSVSPGNDVGVSFADGKVQVFTIRAATGNKEVLLHYNVSIIKEKPEVRETLKITSFTFEESKNRGIIPNDITISKRAEKNGGDENIYLLVPVGTDFTKLVPTITYDGTKLYYTQDTSIAPVNMDVEFPTVDTSFNFKYPKSFFLVVKDKNNDKLKVTEVIVDVINPVRIEPVSVTTPDILQGAQGTTAYYTEVAKWVNQGNHKIIFQKATTYEGKSPVVTPDFNVIEVYRSLPPRGGLAPGENAKIDVLVSRYFPVNTYKTTAVFYTKIHRDNGSDDLFEPAKVTITSKIIKP